MGNYPAYPAYQDSGVPWLGEIPIAWQSLPLKRVTVFAYGDSLAADERTEGEVDVFGSNGPIGKHGVANTKGPVIVIGRKGSFGKLTFSDKPAFAIDTTFFIDEACTNHNLRWLFFVLSVIGLDELSKDSAVPGLSREDAYARIVPVPPLAEQRAIARFLDHKTAQIDALIAKKQALLAALAEKRRALITHAVTRGLDPAAPLRDSGIPWLGEIPAHWEVISIKFALAVPITDGPHETPTLLDDGIPFISAEAIKDDQIDFSRKRGYISEEEHKRFSKKYTPQFGDVYMVKSGATTGNVARVQTHEMFSVWSPLAALRPNTSISTTDFIFYAMKSRPFQHAVTLSWSYGTQQNIGMNVIANIQVALPPLDEQHAISEFLEQWTERLSLQTEKIHAAIAALREYRAALITHAVTGQIDVRGLPLPPAPEPEPNHAQRS